MAHKAKTAVTKEGGNHPQAAVDTDRLRREIELRAYQRYCERGCVTGGDVDDWLVAEQEVLTAHGHRTPRDE